MNRTYRALLAAVLCVGLLFGLACSESSAPTAQTEAPPAAGVSTVAPPTGSASAPARAVETRATATRSTEPSADLAFAHVEKLAGEIGVRVAGTREEHTAAEYLAATLRDYGYDVELQPFGVEAFISRSVSFAVESTERRTITAQPITLSPPGSASGELVYAGLGRADEFPANTRGRIALVQRGEIYFREKALNAEAAGATAIVVFNNDDELFTGTLREAGPTIPVLAISGVDGQRLSDQLRAGPVRASLNFDGGVTRSESFNVIARSPGSRCRVVLGGHYDSVPGAPGASDNATGTAAVLEMARITALNGNPHEACFVGFAAEEIGLNGSDHFVRQLSPADRQALRFMLNFDMVAVGTEWLLIGSSRLQEQAGTILANMGVSARATELLGASSDHASFINAGIPALFLHRYDDPLLHTPEDVVGRVPREQLAEAVRIGLAFLAGLKP